MYPALRIAKTGLDAQQTNMSVIAHNLANVNTTGYKRDRAVFNDLIYQNLRQVGAPSSESTELPSGLMVGTGVKVVATQKQHSQGNIVQTGNSLDVAIQGKGYFQVLHPDGSIVYSRDGTYSLSADGVVVTPNGYQLQPAMTVPNDATSVTIGSDGIVSVLQAGNTDPTQIGQIELAYFANPQGLEPIGDNLFRESAASGGVNTAIPGSDSTGTLMQGALESSNVNVVEELVNMIETQRAYEMNSKAISTTDEMLSYINNQL
ncbi:flagellar basal body rod protein FlgG [Candidatus Endoriftia persephone str. Guaymas]|jgi:flagellar basal-body rod protein FlgG|uniref:Flagellar basal-body rod protein FlgG n=4 Tax=Gammaproteobacteria TaxID=1236 RepID=G2FB45_9GAMM|nr:flagellar basal-body rod protein FlgG [Candidatus Endoriftia persephone]MBA1330252.1 flagellar basal body rod protein FlgG [Candidatus Endoriftia persephone str. Guaymas]EGV51085.1 flagellar basal-body rod protein flgG [endosymbiont of Riftia pachyptila (vent Ph05)]EGW55983.1 flagellar basal-body rod protein FlgG [endosymbiont of Tevnia jerichonana (vent Tica)]KRT56296.1 flagellar basal-body rod protein FlgG, Gram-negative bacteria [endosymbiont of Ridgeia piscesae]KRT58810.1 flagellar basa